MKQTHKNTTTPKLLVDRYNLELMKPQSAKRSYSNIKKSHVLRYHWILLGIYVGEWFQQLCTRSGFWLSRYTFNNLPLIADYDSILVLIDRLTKMSHLIPCTKSITACQTQPRLQVSWLSSTNLVRPKSSFWFKILETIFWIITPSSLAFHVFKFWNSTSGVTFHITKTLLTLAEFSYKNTYHTCIQCSPFFANYGFDPATHPTILLGP